jgi:hypothetical protein
MTLCGLECRGADRDSVVSKTPASNRDCLRYHTYNTLALMESETHSNRRRHRRGGINSVQDGGEEAAVERAAGGGLVDGSSTVFFIFF